MHQTRVAVLLLTSSAVSALLQAGVPPVEAVLIALLASAGGVEVGCRLTGPFPALRIRVVVVIVVVSAVLGAVTAGFPPFASVGLVVLAAACAVEIGRRLTGVPYQWPTWSPVRV